MSRRPRVFVPGGFYHVTARGNHQQPLFRDTPDYRILEHIVAEALEPAHARVHAYCWMTNHIHLLVEVGDLPLGVLMQRVESRFARAVQKRVPTTGHLFEERYHAVLVDVDAYLLVLLRYIHLNPVRAGMVASPDEYPWSSHGVYAGRRQVSWVTTALGLSLFSPFVPEAQARYRCYIGTPVEAPEPLLDSANRRVPGNPSLEESRRQRPVGAACRTLPDLAADVCREYAVAPAELVSRLRRVDLCRARDALAARVAREGVASQQEVAAFLGRSVAAVSRAAARGQRAAQRRKPDATNDDESVQLCKT